MKGIEKAQLLARIKFSSASIMGSPFLEEGNSIHFYNGVDVQMKGREQEERERMAQKKNDMYRKLFFF